MRVNEDEISPESVGHQQLGPDLKKAVNEDEI